MWNVMIEMMGLGVELASGGGVLTNLHCHFG